MLHLNIISYGAAYVAINPAGFDVETAKHEAESSITTKFSQYSDVSLDVLHVEATLRGHSANPQYNEDASISQHIWTDIVWPATMMVITGTEELGVSVNTFNNITSMEDAQHTLDDLVEDMQRQNSNFKIDENIQAHICQKVFSQKYHYGVKEAPLVKNKLSLSAMPMAKCG